LTIEENKEEKIKLKPEWKPVSLCGVVGFFEDSNLSRVAFGGYIKVIEKEGKFKGELIDTYGPSEIEGSLKGNRLMFKKKYTFRPKERPDKIIEYNLEKTESGHFEGEFSVSGISTFRGRAKIWIYKIEENAYWVVAGPPIPESKTEEVYKKG
jgi:hypothetical protein